MDESHVSVPLPFMVCTFQSPPVTETLHQAVIRVTQQAPACQASFLRVGTPKQSCDKRQEQEGMAWGDCVELHPK